ncbi:MAG: DciA family protein [Nitriliruptorales bacterium]
MSDSSSGSGSRQNMSGSSSGSGSRQNMSGRPDPPPPQDVTWVDEDDTLRTAGSPRALGELLEALAERRRWGARLEAAGIFSSWDEIVGPDFARRCEPVRLAGGVLVVRAESQAWATQIGYLEGEIRRRADEALRPGLVRQVKVTVGPLQGTTKRRS